MHLHALVQFFSFGIIPLYFAVLVFFLRLLGVFPELLLSGMVFLGAVPTTVSAGPIMVGVAGGDVASATFNAVLGNVLGIFVTPLLVLVQLGSTGDTNFLGTIVKISLVVVMPVVVGHLARLPLRERLKRKPIKTGKFGNTVILIVIWQSFSDTFSSGTSIDPWTLVLLLPVLVVSCLIFLTVAFVLSALKLLSFDVAQRIVLFFTGTQKTLAAGIPLLTVVFEGNPNAGVVAIPLLMYHPMQLVVASFVAPRVKGWMKRGGGAAGDGGTAPDLSVAVFVRPSAAEEAELERI